MARTSKAAKIREYVAKHPDAKAADVVAALRSKGVKVTAPHVYQLMAKNGKPKRAKGDKYAALIEAKKLADKLGGVDRAREAVEALAKLL
jgi:hypothetical protein